jgi:hypothetical protein
MPAAAVKEIRMKSNDNNSGVLSMGWLLRLKARLRLARWPTLGRRAIPSCPDETLEDADVDQLHAWSISARLAAVPDLDLSGLPESVSALVLEARALHPVMADGARKREQ